VEKVDEEETLLVMLSVNEVNKNRNKMKIAYLLSGWARRPKPHPHRLPTPIKGVVVNVRRGVVVSVTVVVDV